MLAVLSHVFFVFFLQKNYFRFHKFFIYFIIVVLQMYIFNEYDLCFNSPDIHSRLNLVSLL